jgi:hypothetical protein
MGMTAFVTVLDQPEKPAVTPDQSSVHPHPK